MQIDGEFEYEKWIDGVRCGRTFTTSGPLLFLTVDNQGPGSVLNVTEPRPVTVHVKALSRFPLGRVQIVSNGVVLKEVETQEREIMLECPVSADQSRWVVARCSRSDRWNACGSPTSRTPVRSTFIAMGSRCFALRPLRSGWIGCGCTPATS